LILGIKVSFENTDTGIFCRLTQNPPATLKDNSSTSSLFRCGQKRFS